MAQEEIKVSGLNFWSEGGSAPDVDIVAVQGLGANPFYTWVKKIPPQENTEPKRFRDRLFWKNNKAQGRDGKDGLMEVIWPRDLLAPQFQSARIATYSYESDWRDRRVNTSLYECGRQLLNVLFQHRQDLNERQRPLVLIGHSLGGLVIQQALVHAVHHREYIDLHRSVAGIIFLGAPFQGSGAAVYGKWLAQLVRIAQQEGLKYTLLETLMKDSRSLHALSIDFWGSYNSYDIMCFYENREADYGPLSTQLVSTQSATLIGKRIMYMHTDHSGLNKFSGMDDPNFALLLPEIWRMAKGGPSVVADRHRRKDAEPAGNVHWGVLRTPNSLFTGRTKLLDRIQGALRVEKASGTKEQKRFVITGLGGQGKSEICLKVADLMRADFWGVFWVDVSSPLTAKRDFIAVAEALGSSVENIDDSLQALANSKRSWLLILDNADDPDFNYQVYLPSGTQGAVIITSRVSDCSRYSTVGSEALEGLGLEHSTQLLLKAAGILEELWPSYDQQAKDVVHLLGSHTLALIQAGAYIAKGHRSLEQYPEEYHRQRKRLLKYRPSQAQSRYKDVYATFEASADVLENSQSETAQDALGLLAILSMLHSSALLLQIFEDAWEGSRQTLRADRTGVDEVDVLGQWHVTRLPGFMTMEAEEWDDYRLVEASSLLASLSLVTQHYSHGFVGLSMHPLTHAWAKDRQNKEQQQQAWISTGSILALSWGQSETWQVYERELRPHVKSYLTPRIELGFSYGLQRKILPIILKCGWILLQMRDDSRLASLLESVYRELGITPSNPSREHLPIWDLAARNLLHLGDSRQAVKLLEHVVKIRETTLAETHPDRLASQHELAGAYEANGQIEQAVELLEHVVKIRETTLAETHPSRLKSQHELAGAYEANGQIEQAVELLEQVVKIEGITLAETHPSRLASQHALAGAYKANGQIEQAVELLEQVVKIEGITLAETHPSRLASQHALAGAYKANGQIEQAVELLEQVVKIEGITLAETHPSRLASQHTLAGAYEANGQIEQAVELLEHVVKIRETTLAETHPDRLASQHELAGAYEANGQIEQAMELLEHVVKIQETTLAETHPSRLASQHTLAGAYEANGQIEQAVELLEHVVEIRETTLAKTHPDRLASQHELAGAYEANGQIEQAMELLEHVVKICKTTLAETHPSRLKSQHALAGAYKANGQIEQAVELLEHVVKIQETTLAKTHPDRLASQHQLAGAYEANGQIEQAVELLEHVVKIQETTLAKTHPDRLASQHELAGAYKTNRQIEQAMELLKHVVKIQETTLAETHPDRLASQHQLAGAYKANGQIEQVMELLEHMVKIKEITLAETHPSRLASQHELAGAYKANGQIERAVELLEQVVKIKEITLAETHPSRLASQHQLASAYEANGQIEQAVELLEQVVKIKETMLAETHPSWLASEDALANALRPSKLA